MNEEENNNGEKNLNYFISKYGGAIIGGIVALILCFTELYKLLICLVVTCVGIFIGNYIQKNKTNVKEKLKEFIDKF